MKDEGPGQLVDPSSLVLSRSAGRAVGDDYSVCAIGHVTFELRHESLRQTFCPLRRTAVATAFSDRLSSRHLAWRSP